VPLFRRGPFDKPNWGKPASYVAYQDGYAAGYRGDAPLTDSEPIRALAVDATGEEIRAGLAAHLYASGHRDGQAARVRRAGDEDPSRPIPS
jgi:hypothetical protein